MTQFLFFIPSLLGLFLSWPFNLFFQCPVPDLSSRFTVLTQLYLDQVLRSLFFSFILTFLSKCCEKSLHFVVSVQIHSSAVRQSCLSHM